MANLNGNKSPSATKSGPGRYHQGGKPGNKLAKPRKTRAYVALMAAWASKRVPNWSGLYDEHGAFTQVGRSGEAHADGSEMRRKWLAGVSAQRGY